MLSCAPRWYASNAAISRAKIAGCVEARLTDSVGSFSISNTQTCTVLLLFGHAALALGAMLPAGCGGAHKRRRHYVMRRRNEPRRWSLPRIDEHAARAYDHAARERNSQTAILNFPTEWDAKQFAKWTGEEHKVQVFDPSTTDKVSIPWVLSELADHTAAKETSERAQGGVQLSYVVAAPGCRRGNFLFAKEKCSSSISSFTVAKFTYMLCIISI